MRKIFDGFVLIMVALVATKVGDAVVFENSVGIAQTAGAIGEEISVDTVGVYEFPATTADTIAVGDTVYWDATNKKITTVSTSMTLAGTSWSAKAGSTAGNVYVKIG